MYKYGIIETEARGKQNRDVVLTWLFEENGTLSIFGAGMLPDYKDGQDRPWQEYAGEVTAVVVDDGITTVGARTFAGYGKLETVRLPDSMSRIGFRAFADCPNLKTVIASKPIAHAYSTNVASAARGVLREDTIYMGLKSFERTPWVHETFGDFYIHRDVLVEYYGKGGEVVVPDRIREIGISAFEGSSVTGVKLPASVRVISAFAFNNTPLRSISLPAAVRKVERYAFGQTTELESVLVGNKDLIIESLAFWKSAVEEEIVLNKKDLAILAKQEKSAAAAAEGKELTREQKAEAAEAALPLRERVVWKEAAKMNAIPGDDEWDSVYHIDSVREAGMDPWKRLEIRRDKKKLIGLTCVDCGKAIVKKMASGGPVMMVCVNREKKTVEFVQSFIKDGRSSYAAYQMVPCADGDDMGVARENTSYLPKADMEELSCIGLWPEEASSGRSWYQAAKGASAGAESCMALLRAWMRKNPGYSLKEI